MGIQIKIYNNLANYDVKYIVHQRYTRRALKNLNRL